MAEAARRIVLVHGAAHGAWCWEEVIPRLQARGYVVDALDLPGAGDDPTPPERVTFDGYTRRVVEVLNARREPALLVGHPWAGLRSPPPPRPRRKR
jgi:alpha-beta hydrolase superfamily lysophospholipase